MWLNFIPDKTGLAAPTSTRVHHHAGLAIEMVVVFPAGSHLQPECQRSIQSHYILLRLSALTLKYRLENFHIL